MNCVAANMPNAERSAKRPRGILACKSLRDVTAEQLEKGKGKLSEVVYRRARHVIGEIERTTHAAKGIRNSNWPTVGQLMYASHYALRDDYEVSCKELDASWKSPRTSATRAACMVAA